MLTATFPAKILLLGEYTILSGSKALAFPYHELKGRWSFENNETLDREISRESLRSFLKHSSEKYIDLTALKKDVEKGLWFDSKIPQGYGVGSSGALIAAIYSKYALKKGTLQEDKTSLARLEDYFHGSSSGLDPLVSYIQKPFLIHSFEEVQILEKPLNLNGFFLLDTGKPRQTGPLVSIFQNKLKDSQFKQGCADVLSRDVNLAIDSLLKNDSTTLQHHLWHISKFQWEYFPEMIPTSLRGPWSKGIETGDYVLKLCGAGGGGFVLGHSQKYRPFKIQKEFPGMEVIDLGGS
jgi:mevalonate kinase